MPLYHYRSEVLEALNRHGLSPRPDTSPQFLRDAINDLYRYQIRRLRQRLLRGEFLSGVRAEGGGTAGPVSAAGDAHARVDAKPVARSPQSVVRSLQSAA